MYIIFMLFSLLIFLMGCEQKLTNPNETKTEIYIGYAVCDSGKIYKSTDGGKNWVLKSSGVQTRLNSVYAFSASVAIAVGDNGAILKTNDGGNNWVIQNSGTNVNLKKITFNSQTNQCWIIGEQGVVLNTSNYY